MKWLFRQAKKHENPAPRSKRELARMILMKIVLYAVLIYGGLSALAFLLQSWIIFPATRDIYRDPSAYRWAFEELMLPVDGETTHGWFVPLENARGVALFSHGNAGNIADRLESIGLLRSFGFSVLAYDYGGYGKSTGRSSEQRSCQDIRAMWRWLTEEKGIPPKKILLFGRSLGGGATAHLAREVEPAAVILESAFLSTVDVAHDKFPWLPARLILRHVFANKDKVADIKSPLLVIHSPDDSIIPYRHGKELFERATEPKQFLEIHGDHNEGFVLSEPIYRKGWEEFLAPILPRPENRD